MRKRRGTTDRALVELQLTREVPSNSSRSIPLTEPAATRKIAFAEHATSRSSCTHPTLSNTSLQPGQTAGTRGMFGALALAVVFVITGMVLVVRMPPMLRPIGRARRLAHAGQPRRQRQPVSPRSRRRRVFGAPRVFARRSNGSDPWGMAPQQDEPTSAEEIGPLLYFVICDHCNSDDEPAHAAPRCGQHAAGGRTFLGIFILSFPYPRSTRARPGSRRRLEARSGGLDSQLRPMVMPIAEQP